MLMLGQIPIIENIVSVIRRIAVSVELTLRKTLCNGAKILFLFILAIICLDTILSNIVLNKGRSDIER